MGAPQNEYRQGTLRIGVSSCLLGNLVRYDGVDQGDPFITGVLGRFAELVPVCPEQECGLGVPREAMRLVGEAGQPHLVVICSGVDHTERMHSWCKEKIARLAGEEMHGFIFKSKSPSCGLEQVKVYPNNSEAVWQRVGTGLFAKAFLDSFPLLPVTDERKLQDLELRDNFIEHVFFRKRWDEAKKEAMTAHGLISFHSANKLQILAHSEALYRELGRVVAKTTTKPIPELFDDYEFMWSKALREIAPQGKHLNVLQHTLGYFKKVITTAEKQALLESFEKYRRGDTPLIVPITLLNHYANLHQEDYLIRQYYLNPHPDELMMRYHA